MTLDLDQAYAVQDAVTRLRVDAGDRVVGYKVGCTGPGTIAQFGMAGPTRGTLFGSEVWLSGAVLPAKTFASPAVEAEMAVVIGSDGTASVAFPIIELHSFVFRRPCRSLDELVANNGLNTGIVRPPDAWVAPRNLLAGSGVLSVAVGGRRLGSGGLWPLPGGAQASVTWLRRHLARHGLVLAPGDIVLTGTALGLYPVEPDSHVVVSLDDAAVECGFDLEPAATF